MGEIVHLAAQNVVVTAFLSFLVIIAPVIGIVASGGDRP